LLLYLAVEGGMHPRSKLAALLWPDSTPHDARTALRNALTVLRRLLDDPTTTPATHSHLLAEQELLGLNPQAPLEWDLDVVQLAFKQAQERSGVPSEEQHATLVAHVQQALALVRGPFLDGFWLREESGFDEWQQQQQELWQVRVLSLFERLSAWQEVAGELEPTRLTLTRWLALDPLSEEAARRLMRVYERQGDGSAALQVYATLRTRLAEELRVKPDAQTVALAQHIRATQSSPERATPPVASRPPGEVVAPLIGRAAAFGLLVERYQLARAGQAQAVLLLGETGVGKTRLASEFVAWARAQGAEVLVGQAFELGGHLPYQPLVEALRTRLEAENAPEDLLEDLWLAELSRLLPELRVRYPDLPPPTQDELSARGQMFEAVARLLDALAQRAPLVLLLDDLHWVESASLDLVRYLGHAWKSHDSRVLLLGTVRSEGLETKSPLAAQLSNLGRDLPLTQVLLQPLSQAETRQLLEAIAAEGDHDMGSSFPAEASSESQTPLAALGNVLFARMGGQPLYLVETLKLLRDRQWLVPRLTAEGTWRLSPTGEMVAALARQEFGRKLLPPSVRAIIQTRLARLSPRAHHLVQASAVLGTQASARQLWQVAEVQVQEGVEALEEAAGSGILHEEEAGAGQLDSYRFVHELMRDVVYTDLGAARRLVLHQRALAVLQSEGGRTVELAYHARASGEAEAAYRYSVQAGDEARAIFAVEEAIGHYEQARALLQTQPPLKSVLSASQVEHLSVSLGRAYAFQNAWQQAQQTYEELLSYAQQHRLPALVSMTLNRLAILSMQQARDRSEVQALLEQAWQQAQSSSDQRTLAETAWNRAQFFGSVWGDPMRALPHGTQALELARAIPDQELQARSLGLLGMIHILGGDFEEAIRLLEAAPTLYASLDNEPSAGRELSLLSFLIGAPPTQSLTNRASEAWCWTTLAFAQVNAGQVQQCIASSRRALALAQESKNGWLQIASTNVLAYGLLEAGSYEESFVLVQQAVTLGRTLPLIVNFQRFLIALGSTYQALQQWEEAQAILEEAVAVAERFDLGPWCVPALTRLCRHWALAGQWERAYSYAMQAIAVRKHTDVALISLDFSSHYETEALLREGDERQAREEVQRQRERLRSNRRFRLPYLRSLALLADWQGLGSQAIDHLREAAGLATDLGLPTERWQIQATLGRVYEAGGEPAQARLAFGEAAAIIQGLAEGIKDETRRARYLAGLQIQPLLQHVQRLSRPVFNDHAEQKRR
jgi:DNA-binding SARP family transcriptional activator